jgi:hypothetical protein
MSRFAYVIRASGFVGLVVGFAVQLNIALLRDPILLDGAQTVPGWMNRVILPLIGGSLAVLFYSTVLDEVFTGWVDLLTIAALGGQWGVPSGIYLGTIVGAGTPAGLLIVVGYAFHTLAALAVAVTFIRRGRG